MTFVLVVLCIVSLFVVFSVAAVASHIDRLEQRVEALVKHYEGIDRAGRRIANAAERYVERVEGK